ncbi:MAG: zf-HC2 domain-containing protein, partial [Planctomycetota bacterium]|nr:zf-HC2 domain-containing protein [Planctomycetota bacterium]
MNCDPEKVDAYFDGELSSQERKSMEEHLAECRTCQEQLNQTRKLDLLYRQNSREGIPAEDRYVQEVRHRVGERQGKSWMSIAALFLLGLTIWNVYDMIRPEQKNFPKKISLRSELLRFSSAEEESVREEIFGWLEAKGDSGLPLLVAALEDPDVRIQIAATQVLSRFRDDRVRELLLESAKKKRNLEPVDSGEWDLEDPAVTSCLYHAMEVAVEKSDPQDLIVMLAGQGDDPEIMDAVTEWVDNLLQSRKEPRQRLAIQILRRIDVEITWWSLIPLLDSPEIGADVVELFRERSGKDFGRNPEA